MEQASIKHLETDSRWVAVQDSFRKEFGDDNYRAWLNKVELFELNGSEIVLSVPTNFIKDWVRREYLDGVQRLVDGQKTWVKKGIKQIVADFYPNVKSVELIVNKAQQQQVIESVEITADTAPKHIEDNVVSISKNNNLYNIGTELNSKFTFENFVVGVSNKLAYSVCKSIVDNSESIFVSDTNPLFLYGNVGLGKTHLCQAIAWGLKEKYPNKTIIYLSAEKFMYLFVQSLQNQDINNFKNRFRNVDVLIIDDIHFIAGKESTQKEFFQTFNVLINENKQIILACDRSPIHLEKVDEQLKSRMTGGLVVDVLDTDYQLRYDIVKFKSKQMNLDITDDIAKFIAEKIITNGRELEGCLKRLLMQQQFMQVKITKQVVEEILADNIVKATKTITIDKIQEKVAEFFKISLSDLKSEKRLKSLVIPRHIAMYLSKKYTQKSFPDIAKKFGGKNHATIIHGVKNIEELILKDSEINEFVIKLTNLINE